MNVLGSSIRRHIPANGKVAKALTILYVVWLSVTLAIIYNFYKSSNHHSISAKDFWIVWGVSFFGSIIPSLVSVLHEGIYWVPFYAGGKKRRQAYLDKLDERQIQTRRQIFEKSYGILVTLIWFGLFLGRHWYINLNVYGTVPLYLNIFIFVTALPSLVAVW